jgi:acylphosphatase
MVDHRADQNEHAPLFGRDALRNWWESRPLDRLTGWMSRTWAARGKASNYAPLQGNGLQNTISWLGINRIPVAITALWVLALGAYGVGYIERLKTTGEGVSAVPTMDLMFFAFAVVGPIAMVWVVVSLLNRTALLSESIVIQSESALALAATVSNLQDSVDALAEGTTGRLERTLDTLEEKTSSSVLALDNAITAALDDTRTTIKARGTDIDETLAATGTAISEVLNSRVAMLDKTLAEASEKLDNAVVDSVILVNSTIRHRSEKFESALDTQRKTFADRLETDADTLANTMQTQAQVLHDTQMALSQRIESSLADSKARLDHALGQNLARQQAGFTQAGKQFEGALSKMSSQMSTALDARSKTIDADLRQNHARLATAITNTANMVETDLKRLLESVRTALVETQDTIAANPPASAGELTNLLGTSAREIIRPEQDALNESVTRLANLEEQARALLLQIDRTSRLNPLMERQAGDAAEVADKDEGAGNRANGLPFDHLPTAETAGALNWTAVVHALDDRTTGVGIRQLVDKTRANPLVAPLLKLRDRVQDGLAEDELFARDLKPEHADAQTWAQFGRGARGKAVASLSGIDDEIALAIARARLRSNPEFRADALRFVACYADLLARAVSEVGTDPRLVEMAETTTGRLFMLIAGLTGGFDPSYDPSISELG